MVANVSLQINAVIMPIKMLEVLQMHYSFKCRVPHPSFKCVYCGPFMYIIKSVNYIKSHLRKICPQLNLKFKAVKVFFFFF